MNSRHGRPGIVDGESKGERVKRIGSRPNWILNSDRCGAVIKQQISLFRRRTLPPAAHAVASYGCFRPRGPPPDHFRNH